jgi:hypothetical protein
MIIIYVICLIHKLIFIKYKIKKQDVWPSIYPRPILDVSYFLKYVKYYLIFNYTYVIKYIESNFNTHEKLGHRFSSKSLLILVGRG